MSKRDVPDDPLLKPASEVGFGEVKKPAAPVVEKTEPAKAEAVTKPVEPAAKPVEPAAKPVEPAAKPAELAAKAVEPAAKPAELAAKAEAKPDKPAEPPAKPAEPPVKLAEPAAKPGRRIVHEEDDADLEDPHGLRFKTIVAAVVGFVAVITIIVFIALGHTNSAHYFLRCEAERAVPQQGRAFPPWGFHALDGDAWHALTIAPETRCQARGTDDVRALERWFLAMILDEANAQLASHDAGKLDETEALLKQCLLLTRPATVAEPETLAADRVAQHKDIERLLGDVSYWRAAVKLRDAAATLGEAAKQFDSALAQHPRHVVDAAAWAAYARKLADQLRVGPAGGAPGAPPSGPAAPSAAGAPASPSAPVAASADEPADHPAAPLGTALPVEPDKPGAAPEAIPVTAPPPDAGVPTGGVLL